MGNENQIGERGKQEKTVPTSENPKRLERCCKIETRGERAAYQAGATTWVIWIIV